MLAEKGFPVSPIASLLWDQGAELLQSWGPDSGAAELLVVDAVDTAGSGAVNTMRTASSRLRPPRAGELFKNPALAASLRELASGGAAQFYNGKVGQAIVAAVRSAGGLLSQSDLAGHQSEFVQPISTECPSRQQPVVTVASRLC
eukprot:SAG31_NODE_7912_length_1567_cov_1.410763_1_plen_144_part_10